MANRLKPPKQKVDEEVLIAEKEESVEIKALVKDERTHKIFGSVLLFISFFLFVAFASYLFTWNEDQDKVRNMGAKILMPNELEISNQLGSLGAYTAYVFFEYGFGVASFLFCSLFFVIGVNVLFGRKVFSVARNIRYLLMGLVVISVSASFFMPESTFNWGGAVGKFSSVWMKGVLGWWGTFSIISLSLFSYFIWRFNPVFKMPVFGKSTQIDDTKFDQTVPAVDLEPEIIQPRLDLTEGNSLKTEDAVLNLEVIEEASNKLKEEKPLHTEPAVLIAPPVEDVVLPKVESIEEELEEEPDLEIKPV
ncbi:MAG: hypothetical protein RLZZ520_345, partial [Bacteroidota bacterium]